MGGGRSQEVVSLPLYLLQNGPRRLIKLAPLPPSHSFSCSFQKRFIKEPTSKEPLSRTNLKLLQRSRSFLYFCSDSFIKTTVTILKSKPENELYYPIILIRVQSRLNKSLCIEQASCKGIHSISIIFLDNYNTINFGNFFLVIITIGDLFSIQKQGL